MEPPLKQRHMSSNSGEMSPRTAAATSGGFHHDYLATIQPEPIMGEIVISTTGQPFVFNAATEISPCWLCNKTDQPETLFTPCQCDGMVHRHCFRKWRQGWINPRNYFNCPRCMHNYTIERVKEATTKSKEEIKQGYRKQLLKLWLGVILFFGTVVFALAGFVYLLDGGHKKVPVYTKYLMSSALNGIPDGNTTLVWEQNFKDPHVPVWPYYTLFATFLTSIVILATFGILGSSFQKSDHSGRTCCSDCDYCLSNNNDVCCCYIIYCDDSNCNCCRGNGRHNRGYYSNSDSCNCQGCDCNGCHGGGGGGSCDCKGCDKDGMQILLVVLVIIIIVIIVSAIFVVIGFTIQRSALLYDRYSAMVYDQQEELEGETIVLGVNETWRPLNAV